MNVIRENPFRKFVKIESSSGILLFLATVIAMIWANSGYADYYHSLWQMKFGLTAQDFQLYKPLILWINDGLMAFFFFLIGLEIKREMKIGELNTLKKSAFPLFAAIGGMAFPIAIFVFLNSNPNVNVGWAVPMATDIAFSLAILSLLGSRVPLSLKIFLTAFAIVDDLGAVLVIAIFYTSSTDWSLILYSMILIGLLFTLNAIGFYSKYIFFLVGVIVWYLFLKAGVHPTIAGVLMALTIPIQRKITVFDYQAKLIEITGRITDFNPDKNALLQREQIEEIDNLETWTDKVQSPLQHLEHKLHGWVAFLIMPIFALSNAGVEFGGDLELDKSLIIGIALALIFGNFIGVMVMSYLGKLSGLVEMPSDMNFKQIAGVSFLAGVGFTMSIFIANLAFIESELYLNSAKMGILLGSVISGIIGYIILTNVLPKKSKS